MSRLIDADALSRIVKLAWETSDSEDFEKSVFIAIATAPTIEERKTVSNEEWTKARGGWTNQPERKTGKWVENSPVTMRCDQCGYVIRDWFWHQFRYCPNCGARMER